MNLWFFYLRQLGRHGYRTGRVGLLCLLCVSLSQIGAAEQVPSETPSSMGVHGLVLFGQQQLFLSHLGLYHPPHDRQIVLAAEFVEPKDRRAYLALAAEGGLITAQPQAFELYRLAPEANNPIRQIVVDVYAGHFERGGRRRLSNVALNLASPIIYRALDADCAAGTASYWWFGTAKEQFLVYRIGARPSRDLIVQIDTPAQCARSVCRLESAQPPVAHRDFDARQPLLHQGKPLHLDAARTLYAETQDFAF